MMFEDKQVPIMAYTLETILAEKMKLLFGETLEQQRQEIFMIYMYCFKVEEVKCVKIF